MNINNYKFKAVCHNCGSESEVAGFEDAGFSFDVAIPLRCGCPIIPDICQFTGFKDGSQKEIFEGDVLLDEYPRHDKDRLVVVVFESGCFELHRFPKGQDKIKGDYLRDMSGAANSGRLLEYTVIGNQWEPIDRLEKKAANV